MDGRIGGEVGGLHPGEVPVRAGGVVAWGVGGIYPGPMLVESDLGAALPGPDRGPILLAVSGSGHNQS